MGFFTGINLVGAVLGFIVGVFGFIIVRYWIRPVSRYRRLKRRAAGAVSDHLLLLEQGTGGSGAGKRFKESQRRLRRLASELTDAFHQELPHWYRIRLRARGEQPPEAAGMLMKLSGTREPEPAKKRAEQIRTMMHL